MMFVTYHGFYHRLRINLDRVKEAQQETNFPHNVVKHQSSNERFCFVKLMLNVSDPMIVENFDDNLPDTVTLLRTSQGAKVYLVGTAHFSIESQDDVSKVSMIL